MVQELLSVTSEPMVVCARELGTNIPRVKIARCVASEAAKASPDSVRLRSQGDRPVDEIKGKLLFEDAFAHVSELVSVPETNTPASEISSATGATDAEVLNTSIESTESVPDLILPPASGQNMNNGDSNLAAEKKAKADHYIAPEVPVYEGSTTYSPQFAFWTVIEH